MKASLLQGGDNYKVVSIPERIEFAEQFKEYVTSLGFAITPGGWYQLDFDEKTTVSVILGIDDVLDRCSFSASVFRWGKDTEIYSGITVDKMEEVEWLFDRAGSIQRFVFKKT